MNRQPISSCWAVLLAGLMLSIPVLSRAQAGCGDATIAEARKYYEFGQFEIARQALQSCLQAQEGFKGDQQVISAHRWLAKINIARDSFSLAQKSVAAILERDETYTPPAEDPSILHTLVRVLKNQGQATSISSVSKTKESLFHTPATVIVLTREEIYNRGYIDLEAFFSDLPGFDVSRTFGSTYSNLYQRGYRANNTDRTLFMINGVEENDMWGNWANWARQYPLTQVKQVEIIYGPASTMYGANAFLGVVNVVTRTPDEIINSATPSESAFPVTAIADVGYGTYNTRFADMTVAGRHRNFAFSFTARRFAANELDLSSNEVQNEYDSDQPVTEFSYDHANYGIAVTDSLYQNAYEKIRGPFAIDETWSDPKGYFDLLGDTAAVLNAAGLARAQQLDQQALSAPDNRNPLSYENTLEHWYYAGEVRIGNLTGGFQWWRTEQSPVNYGTQYSRSSADVGNHWVPVQSHVFVRYGTDIGKKLYLSNLAQYRNTTISDATNITTVSNYIRGNLGVTDLLKGTAPTWKRTYFHQSSRQFRNELKAVWHPVSQFSLVSGLELRNSLIQGDYLRYSDSKKNIYKLEELYNPQNDTSWTDTIQSGDFFHAYDLGFYTQGTYQVVPNRVKLTAGVRLDNNRVRANGGYGTVVNPRFAVVIAPGKTSATNNGEAPFVVKAIYASAFKDASNREKFSLGTTRTQTNPTLAPERVRNLELVFGYQRGKQFSGDVAAYRSWYTNAVGERPATNGTSGNQLAAVGRLNIYGLQANGQVEFDLGIDRPQPLVHVRLYANATFTDATELARDTTDQFIETTLSDSIGNETTYRNFLTGWDNSDNDVRVGDIARFQANAGVHLSCWYNRSIGSNRLHINVRTNYIAPRKTGAGTSVDGNPFTEFDEVFLLNSAFTWRDLGIPGLSAQFTINNLLDQKYLDPGIRTADGISQAARIPQRGRNFMIRLSYNIL